MTDIIQAQVKRGYLLKMSVGKFEIQIDEDELPKVIEAMKMGAIIKLRRGIIRSDLIAGIIEDRERIVVIEKLNPDMTRRSEVRLLKDIFKDTKLLTDREKGALRVLKN